MANEDHLSILNQGVAVWNEWRKSNEKIIPHLSKANLYNTDLSLFNFQNVNLSQANLSSTNLNKTNLTKANLSGANLLSSNLSGANLSEANLNYIIVRQTKIDSETVIDPKLHLVWQLVNQTGGNRELKGVDLSQTNLFGVDLSNSDLSHANLSKTNLSNTNLSRVYFYQTNLEQANLQNADLSNAYLSQANLRKVNLWGASLKGTYLRDADLRFASWHQAKIDSQTIINSKWHLVWAIVNQREIQLNLKGSDLSNTNLRGTNFLEANLSEADLSNSDLRGCCFVEANLSQANLRGTNLCGANLNQANLEGTKLQKSIGDRYTQFPTNFNPTKAGVIISNLSQPKEEVTKIQTITPPESPQKSHKKDINWLIVWVLIILVTFGGYYFWSWRYNFNSLLEDIYKLNIKEKRDRQ
jgi:uncharacterized protein YjbI with pentapeptide repeats